MKIHDNKNNNILKSSRAFLLQPKSRCFCIWTCKCVCIGAYFDITKQKDTLKCQNIKSNLKVQAGFMDSFPFENEYVQQSHEEQEEKDFVFDPASLFFLPLFVLLFIFFLGKYDVVFVCNLFCILFYEVQGVSIYM